MTKKVITTFHNEGKVIGEAAKELARNSVVGAAGVGDAFRKAGVVFKEGSATNKLSIVGGISTGMTFALTGLRTVRNALHKDEKTGKRDYASAALGATELLGGSFVAALFWQRMQTEGTNLMNAKQGGSDGPSR